MILSEDDITPEQESLISTFISSLWDVGNFKPGISVRTIASCVEQATNDLTVATALIEARLITGNQHLARWPRRIVSQTWTDKTFFDAKMQEQAKRYAQHNHTESNLEPDIKMRQAVFVTLTRLAGLLNGIFGLIGFMILFISVLFPNLNLLFWRKLKFFSGKSVTTCTVWSNVMKTGCYLITSAK